MRNPIRARRRATTVVSAALMAGGMMLSTGASAAVSQISPSDRDAIVAEHNQVRQAVGAPLLVWDDAVAAGAQAWADNPASIGSNTFFHDTSYNNGAENISGQPPAGGTGDWAKEKSAYDADPNHDPDANRDGYYFRWGHYYNMINTRWGRIGCGAKQGAIGIGWITVCRYE